MVKKLSAQETAEFFEGRAPRADIVTFDRIMNRLGGEPPRMGDKVPKQYKRRGSKTAT